MDKTEIVNKLKSFFATDVDKKLTFAIIRAVDKWDIEVDAETIEVGTQLHQVGFEGEVWSLSDGEYELEDGRTIQVDSEGIVVLISDAEGESTETPEGEGESTEEEMNKDEKPAEVEVNLADVTTKEGVILTVNEDGSVMIGEEIAADGEYILEDDSIIVVKDGMKVEDEEVPAEDVEDETADVELSARVDALELALSELLSMFNTNKKEMSVQIKAISNEPAAEEVKVKKTFSKSKKSDKADVLEIYANLKNKAKQ